jgi:sigma-B regulation protein RsbU (phosphoserine phosphatase)
MSINKTKMKKKVSFLSDQPLDYQLNLKDRALEAVAEGITISDTLQDDNPIVYANEGFERLTGYKKEDVLGINCRFLQGSKTEKKKIDEIRTSIHQKKSCFVEILNYRKDGTPFWNGLSITPIRDESGKVTNFIGIQSDITRRKKFENALYRVSAKLEQTNQQLRKDLEDARHLQLAMLPSKLPELPYLDIAVAMTTAQEVGGDYYDFYQNNTDLTFAIGDATGHGLKAGTIVTATKVLFNSVAPEVNPRNILSKMSASLKDMRFKNMFMAMLIAKITSKEICIASAGMPYPFVYKRSDNTIEEVQLKGMPLGSFTDFPYKSQTLKIKKGDCFLFHSDGLAECFNKNRELFGESRIRSLFEKLSHESPAQIIKELTNAARQWMGKSELRDDITLVVMKVK